MRCFLPVLLCLSFSSFCFSQGTWTPLKNQAPDSASGSGFQLLSDGTVICHMLAGSADGFGTVWDRLMPDAHGSYVNGTWSRIAPMNDSRIYFASQMLMDGRVFVAGGEYGSGGYSAEVYDPVSNAWTRAPGNWRNLITPTALFYDASSEILPDGKIIISTLDTTRANNEDNETVIYDPVANVWSKPPACKGRTDETNWVKLRDSSILFVNLAEEYAERYIPALNEWILDAKTPAPLFDALEEIGATVLLPDGRVLVVGATSNTALYSPSGNTSPGSWVAGPTLPNGRGMDDAPAAMLVNGKVLFAAGTSDSYNSPITFFEFDYTTNLLTQVSGPTGDSLTPFGAGGCYETLMIDLPDGNVLFSQSPISPYPTYPFLPYTTPAPQYYVYSPVGNPLSEGKPSIVNVWQTGCTYNVSGTLFNGISEGAAYGDDDQVATNFPIVRLALDSNVFYARSFNWNSTCVQTGSFADTTQFTVPPGLAAGTYSLQVIANGIASDPVSFDYKPCVSGIQQAGSADALSMKVYPNPATDFVTLNFHSAMPGAYVLQVYDVLGSRVSEFQVNVRAGENSAELNVGGLAQGIYLLRMESGSLLYSAKVIVR